MRNIFKRKEKEQLRKCDLHLTINPKSPAQETFNNRIFFIPKALFNSELKVHFEWFIDNYEENESGFAERWVRQIGYEQIQKHIHTYTHTDQEVGKVVWGRLKDRQDSQPHPRSIWLMFLNLFTSLIFVNTYLEVFGTLPIFSNITNC